MFNIGDKVVYPMHGAGVIESIEEKEMHGSKRSYYVMNMPLGEMKVMIPMDNACQVGLREVIDSGEVEQVYSVLREPCEANGDNWNRRYTANLEKIKTGNILEIAEVVKNLVHRKNEKGLSAGEKKMLDSAHKLLVSELVLVEGIETTQVDEIIEGLVVKVR